MAQLSDDIRTAIRHAIGKELSRNREPIAVIKSDLKAAVDAVDSWVEANKASFNSALPEPAKTQLTAKQKSMLLSYVVSRRFQEGE